MNTNVPNSPPFSHRFHPSWLIPNKHHAFILDFRLGTIFLSYNLSDAFPINSSVLHFGLELCRADKSSARLPGREIGRRCAGPRYCHSKQAIFTAQHKKPRIPGSRWLSVPCPLFLNPHRLSAPSLRVGGRPSLAHDRGMKRDYI